MVTLPGLQRHCIGLLTLLTASVRPASASINTRHYKTEAWQLTDGLYSFQNNSHILCHLQKTLSVYIYFLYSINRVLTETGCWNGAIQMEPIYHS